MLIVNSFLENIIRKLKKDSSYKLSSHYSLHQYLFILLYRIKQIFRGLRYKLFFKSSIGLIFCGKQVSVEHAYQVQAGRNLILEDFTYLNALSKNGIKFGENVTLGRGSTLICTGVINIIGTGISIGNNTGINAYTYIGGQGGVTIGNNVIIGPYVKIFSENHNFSAIDIPVKLQGESRKGVSIKDNCWIGAGAIILDGVTIESGVVVAAGSVVTKSISANNIVGGVPAKIIKGRN